MEPRENFLLRWELMPAKTLVGLVCDKRSRGSWRSGVRNKAEEVILAGRKSCVIIIEDMEV